MIVDIKIVFFLVHELHLYCLFADCVAFGGS